jgi:hypothetical protein
VASGIFSRQWAGILTEAVVADPPDPTDPVGFGRWVTENRESWNRGIDVSRLAWHQKAKLRDGAFSTLLWIRLLPADADVPGRQKSWRLRVFAVGDSCLIHVRDGNVLRTFPVTKTEELEANPVVIGSVDLGRDEQVEFLTLDDTCRCGDLIVLCTDAIAGWALQLRESGNPPAWEDFWDMARTEWQQEISRLRAEGRMRYDDATLMLLKVTDGSRAAGNEDEVTEPSVELDDSSGPPHALSESAAEDSAPESKPDQPPPPPPSPESELTDKLKSFSEQVAGQVSEQVSRGWGKLKKMKGSAEAAFRKIRDTDRSKPPEE